jgi:hypothetical protein
MHIPATTTGAAFIDQIFSRIGERAAKYFTKHASDVFKAVDHTLGNKAIKALEDAGISGITLKPDEISVVSVSKDSGALKRYKRTLGAKLFKKLRDTGAVQDAHILRYSDKAGLDAKLAKVRQLPNGKTEHANGAITSKGMFPNLLDSQSHYIPISDTELLVVSNGKLGDKASSIKQKFASAIDKLSKAFPKYAEKAKAWLLNMAKELDPRSFSNS